MQARDRGCQPFPRIRKVAAHIMNTLRTVRMGQSAGNIADDFVKSLGSEVHLPLGGLELVAQNFMYAFMIHGHAT